MTLEMSVNRFTLDSQRLRFIAGIRIVASLKSYSVLENRLLLLQQGFTQVATSRVQQRTSNGQRPAARPGSCPGTVPWKDGTVITQLGTVPQYRGLVTVHSRGNHIYQRPRRSVDQRHLHIRLANRIF